MAPRTRTRTLRARALAKINLSLRILGTHADGYHELRTTFQSIALHDTLTLTPVDGPFALTCDDPACPTDDTNLVWRAAERLWRADKRRGRPAHVRIHLTKRIPMQAGLGGGSSDAAAALRGLSRLWRTNVPEDRLQTIASELGADVSFFLQGGIALGAGRGDILFGLDDRPPAFVVLVTPDFGVSTRDAYKWWDAAHPSGLISSPHRPGFEAERGNDLELAVGQRHPAIRQIVQRLKKAGADDAAMSGSGSAVFGLFSDEVSAFDAGDAIAGPARRVIITRTVDRKAYTRLTRPA